MRNDAADPIDRNAEAVGVIPTIRSPVYAKSRLRTGKGARTSTDSKSANGERERRKAERRFFHELSKYYPLRQGQSFWARPPLLSRGKHEHNTRHDDDLQFT